MSSLAYWLVPAWVIVSFMNQRSSSLLGKESWLSLFLSVKWLTVHGSMWVIKDSHPMVEWLDYWLPSSLYSQDEDEYVGSTWLLRYRIRYHSLLYSPWKPDDSEIIGKVTDVPWAFIFYNVDDKPRHPGQLYEAIAYLIIFLFIYFIYRKYSKKVGTGLYFGLCLTLIFTFRFFIEYTKEIQEAFEAGLPIDMGQILSIPLIALGVWSILRSRGKEGKLP